jgi:hypothetical protein
MASKRIEHGSQSHMKAFQVRSEITITTFYVSRPCCNPRVARGHGDLAGGAPFWPYLC